MNAHFRAPCMPYHLINSGGKIENIYYHYYQQGNEDLAVFLGSVLQRVKPFSSVTGKGNAGNFIYRIVESNLKLGG